MGTVARTAPGCAPTWIPTHRLMRMARPLTMWRAGQPAVTSAELGQIASSGPGATRIWEPGPSSASPCPTYRPHVPKATLFLEEGIVQGLHSHHGSTQFTKLATGMEEAPKSIHWLLLD